MPMLNRVAKLVTKPLPRTISPTTHAIVNYIAVGTFLAGAALFWRRNKRAAVAALVCATADLAVTLLTDSPAAVNRVISFPTRRHIDTGLAAMFATMPQFLAFEGDREKTLFLVQGAVLTALAELSHAPQTELSAQKNDSHPVAA